MDFFLAVWPRRTPAVKRAQEMGKFQLDTDQESRGPVFTTTGALVLTPVELEDSVWYYGTMLTRQQGRRIISHSQKLLC